MCKTGANIHQLIIAVSFFSFIFNTVVYRLIKIKEQEGKWHSERHTKEHLAVDLVQHVAS